MAEHHEHHSHDHQHDHHHHHERRTGIVVYLTAFTMVAEVVAGYYTGSLSLLADGWHMASHVFAIGLAWFAYYYARKHRGNERFTKGTAKVLSLSGYTSAIILLVVALFMFSESIERLIHPSEVKFKEAIIVAVIGLIVNALSAWFLHHDDEHSDHNVKAAYIHVLTDMLTSVVAIGALLAGMYWQIFFLDAIGGIAGSVVIAIWAIGLIKNSAKDLLDYK